VEENVHALEDRVPSPSGRRLRSGARGGAGARARAAGLYAELALGAVLMMRFARRPEAAAARREIVELHHDQKLDAPSGTAKATAALLPPDADPLRQAAGARRAPGGDLRRPGTDVDDPPTRPPLAGVRAGRPALEMRPRAPAGLTVGLDALL
jgi:hypothetical protein